MKKTFLVTGGAGFIGSNIVKSLAKKNRVVVYDDFSRGKKNIFRSLNNKNIKLISGDIRNKEKLKNSLKKIDAVIHLAYINGTRYFYSKPSEVLDVGIKGLMNVVDCCIEKEIKELYLASSSEVYHHPKEIPTSEDVELKIPDVHNPRYSYGGGKILTELVGIHYGKKYFKRLIIFRPHNVFGENMGNEHVIPQITNRILRSTQKGEEFFIRGSGNEIRSFIYIDDFIKGLNLIIEKGKHLNIYNIGTTNILKIKELVLKIAKILELKIALKKKPIHKGGTPIRCPNIDKIKKIGFKNTTKFSTSLRKTVMWYKDKFYKNEKKINL